MCVLLHADARILHMPKVTLLGDTIPKQYLLCVYSRRGLAMRDLHIADRGVRESSGAKKTRLTDDREAGITGVFRCYSGPPKYSPIPRKQNLNLCQNQIAKDTLRSANTEDTANDKNGKGQKCQPRTSLSGLQSGHK